MKRRGDILVCRPVVLPFFIVDQIAEMMLNKGRSGSAGGKAGVPVKYHQYTVKVVHQCLFMKSDWLTYLFVVIH